MAFRDPQTETLAKPDREYLEKNRHLYERAKDFVAKYGEEDREHLLSELMQIVNTYQPDKDPPHKAVYLLGLMKQMIADRNFHRNIIEEYDIRLDRMRDRAARDREMTGVDPTPSD